MRELSISGQKYVAPGTSAKFAAKVNSDASSKALTWTISPANGATINASNGQVKLDKSAVAGTVFTVKATAKDNGKKSATYSFTVKKKATKVAVNKTSVTLGVVARGNIAKSATIAASSDNGTTLVWSTSNAKVASISQSGNNVTVSGVASGSATLTAKAQDGSGKQATVKVKVVTPVSGMTLAVANGQYEGYVATGCSLPFKACVGNTYGNPTNKKVNWSYSLLGVKSNGETVVLPAATQEVLKKNNAFYKFSNGKITANNTKTFNANMTKYKSYLSGYSDVAIRVTATAADGSGCAASKTVKPVDKCTVFGIPATNQWGLSLIARNINVPVKINLSSSSPYVAIPIAQNGGLNNYTVTSSNPKAICGTFEYISSKKAFYLVVRGLKKGSGTVTIKSTDGSNLTAKVSIKVVGSSSSTKSTSSTDSVPSDIQILEYVEVK